MINIFKNIKDNIRIVIFKHPFIFIILWVVSLTILLMPKQSEAKIVSLDSNPQGATVWLLDKDKPLCEKTPCIINVNLEDVIILNKSDRWAVVNKIAGVDTLKIELKDEATIKVKICFEPLDAILYINGKKVINENNNFYDIPIHQRNIIKIKRQGYLSEGLELEKGPPFKSEIKFKLKKSGNIKFIGIKEEHKIIIERIMDEYKREEVDADILDGVVPLEVGQYDIKIHRDGFEDQKEERVTIKYNKTKKIKIKQKPYRGTLKLKVFDAENNKQKIVTTSKIAKGGVLNKKYNVDEKINTNKLAVGNYKLKIKRYGYKTKSTTFNIKRDETTQLEVDLKKKTLFIEMSLSNIYREWEIPKEEKISSNGYRLTIGFYKDFWSSGLYEYKLSTGLAWKIFGEHNKFNSIKEIYIRPIGSPNLMETEILDDKESSYNSWGISFFPYLYFNKGFFHFRIYSGLRYIKDEVNFTINDTKFSNGNRTDCDVIYEGLEEISGSEIGLGCFYFGANWNATLFSNSKGSRIDQYEVNGFNDNISNKFEYYFKIKYIF